MEKMLDVEKQLKSIYQKVVEKNPQSINNTYQKIKQCIEMDRQVIKQSNNGGERNSDVDRG